MLATAAAPSERPLQVGPLRAAAGEALSGWLEVPDGSDPGTRIPVSVVNGAQPGPVLALVAGTHGYEYTSIVALPRVLARLDPARMKGSVILVHMANPPGFYGRRIYYGPDGKNLNRVFPAMRSAYPSEWVRTLDRALAMDVERYVPGHGFIEEPRVSREELVAFRDAVAAVSAEARRLHAAGLSAEDAVKAARWGDYGDWFLAEQQAPIAIRRVYAELEGTVRYE